MASYSGQAHEKETETQGRGWGSSAGNEWAHPDRGDGRCRLRGGKGRCCGLPDSGEQWGGGKDGELRLSLGTEISARLPRGNKGSGRNRLMRTKWEPRQTRERARKTKQEGRGGHEGRQKGASGECWRDWQRTRGPRHKRSLSERPHSARGQLPRSGFDMETLRVSPPTLGVGV